MKAKQQLLKRVPPESSFLSLCPFLIVVFRPTVWLFLPGEGTSMLPLASCWIRSSSQALIISCLGLLLMLCSTSTRSYSWLIWFISAFMRFCARPSCFAPPSGPPTFFPSRCCRWFWAMMRKVNCCSLLFILGKVCPKKFWNSTRSTALISKGKVGSRTALLTYQQLCSGRVLL